MNNKQLKKLWNMFLLEVDKTEIQLAKEINTPQQNINRKINSGTIKFIELCNILEKYGYTIEIRKKE